MELGRTFASALCHLFLGQEEIRDWQAILSTGRFSVWPTLFHFLWLKVSLILPRILLNFCQLAPAGLAKKHFQSVATSFIALNTLTNPNRCTFIQDITRQIFLILSYLVDVKYDLVVLLNSTSFQFFRNLMLFSLYWYRLPICVASTLNCLCCSESS